MGFKLVGGFPESFVIEATVTAGTAIAEGDMLVINGNVLERAGAAAPIHTIFGVAAETISTTATKIKVKPVCQGQLWEGLGGADANANQLFESVPLTDHATLNNSAGDTAGPTGVFLILGYAGATTDRRILGEFTRLQSTST